MKVYGHESVRSALQSSAGVHQVCLLLGPASVGKSTVIQETLRWLGIPSSLTYAPGKLGAEAARDLKRFARVRPSSGQKAAVLPLEEASPEALNAILKILEEPPPFLRIFMTATKRPPLTIVSRSQVFQLGYLSDEDVKNVLIAKFGLRPQIAEEAARAARGQVRRAQEYTEIESLKAPVISLMKAVHDGDRDLFRRVAVSWDRKAHQLLLTWMQECITGQHRVFHDSDFFGMSARTPGLARAYKSLQQPSRPKIAMKNSMRVMLEA